MEEFTVTSLRWSAVLTCLLIPQMAQFYCLDTASLEFSPPAVMGTADWDRTACPSQRSEQVGPAGMSPIGLGEGKKKGYGFWLFTQSK